MSQEHYGSRIFFVVRNLVIGWALPPRHLNGIVSYFRSAYVEIIRVGHLLIAARRSKTP